METGQDRSHHTGNAVMGLSLNGANRCPHCSIASPRLSRVWSSDGTIPRTDGSPAEYWGCYACANCGSVVTAKATPGGGKFLVTKLFPEPKTAHADIPDPAKTFLQQAYDTLHAPDAAAVMAGSAVDAMLKLHDYVQGSLYERIDQALKDNLLTKGMADWAHEVRLGSNRPRHADKEKPHTTAEEAKQSVDFAEALGNFLFALTARISRGIEAAKTATPTK